MALAAIGLPMFPGPGMSTQIPFANHEFTHLDRGMKKDTSNWEVVSDDERHGWTRSSGPYLNIGINRRSIFRHSFASCSEVRTGGGGRRDSPPKSMPSSEDSDITFSSRESLSFSTEDGRGAFVSISRDLVTVNPSNGRA